MAQIKKIVWSNKSVNNLDEISEYISINSPLYAPVFIQKIIKSVERLKDFPNSGRIVPEFNNKNIREIIFHNYRIVYRIKNNFVEIILVTHGTKIISGLK